MLVRYTREIPPNTTIQHRKNGKGCFYEAEVLSEAITTTREFREYVIDYISRTYYESPQVYINRFRAVLNDGSEKLEIELI